jgi:hypothetical protein
LSGRLYKRGARLTAQLGNPAPGAWFEAFQTVQDTLVITDMRVQFEITRDLSKAPNRAKLVITNLSQQTRQDLQNKRPLRVALEVGYDGQLEEIFRGDATLVDSEHDRTNWLTHIQCGDGERGLANAWISTTLNGASAKDVITQLAGSIGLSVPTNIATAKAFFGKLAGGSGITLHGQTADEMTRVLDSLGYSWSIQGEQLQVLGPGEVTSDTALLVSQSTGMIGVPNYELPKQPGKPAVLKVKTVAKPQAVPGRQLLMASASINGLFRIEKVVHRGDTMGTQWESEIRAVMI